MLALLLYDEVSVVGITNSDTTEQVFVIRNIVENLSYIIQSSFRLK